MSRARRGESKQPTRASDDRGLAEELFELAIILEGFCEAGPDPRRVDLRDFRARLIERYGLDITESDVAQSVAEEDGTPVE